MESISTKVKKLNIIQKIRRNIFIFRIKKIDAEKYEKAPEYIKGDRQVVEKLCDRISIIKKGRIVASTSLEELKAKKISLEQYYLNIINDDQIGSKAMRVESKKEKEEVPASKFFAKKIKKGSIVKENYTTNEFEVRNKK